MEIPREFRPTDPVARKRVMETPGRVAKPQAPVVQAPRTDRAEVAGELDPAAVQRYVQILKGMNPVDLHRVEDLRQRIADGSYTAEADDLAELLTGGGQSPRRA